MLEFWRMICRDHWSCFYEKKLSWIFEFQYPGIGLLILLLAITAVGLIGSVLIELPFFGIVDKKLEKAPLIKLIYSSMKDLVSAFVGNKKSFNKPVLLKLYENSEIRRLGFITDESSDLLEVILYAN